MVAIRVKQILNNDLTYQYLLFGPGACLQLMDMMPAMYYKIVLNKSKTVLKFLLQPQ